MHEERQADTAQAEPTLPAIRESTGTVPCPPKPTSTLELRACAAREVAKTNDAVEARARAVFRLLGPRGRRALARGERAWLAYRKHACTAEASRYEGGSAQPLVFADCVARQNRRHLSELSTLERALRRR